MPGEKMLLEQPRLSTNSRNAGLGRPVLPVQSTFQSVLSLSEYAQSRSFHGDPPFLRGLFAARLGKDPSPSEQWIWGYERDPPTVGEASQRAFKLGQPWSPWNQRSDAAPETRMTEHQAPLRGLRRSRETPARLSPKNLPAVSLESLQPKRRPRRRQRFCRSV